MAASTVPTLLEAIFHHLSMREDEITSLRYLSCRQADRITELQVKMEREEIRRHLEIREKQERLKTMETILDEREALKYNGNPYICVIKLFSSICRQMSGGQIQYFESKPFFQRNYLLCLRVQVDESERLGLYLHLVKSSKDNSLPWPAEIKFSISLLDQSGCPVATREDISVTCEFTASDPASQQPQGDINPEGIGQPNAVPLDIAIRAPYCSGDIVMIKVNAL